MSRAEGTGGGLRVRGAEEVLDAMTFERRLAHWSRAMAGAAADTSTRSPTAGGDLRDLCERLNAR